MSPGLICVLQAKPKMFSHLCFISKTKQFVSKFPEHKKLGIYSLSFFLVSVIEHVRFPKTGVRYALPWKSCDLWSEIFTGSGCHVHDQTWLGWMVGITESMNVKGNLIFIKFILYAKIQSRSV